jgi:hypothetical protein
MTSPNPCVTCGRPTAAPTTADSGPDDWSGELSRLVYQQLRLEPGGQLKQVGQQGRRRDLLEQGREHVISKGLAGAGAPGGMSTVVFAQHLPDRGTRRCGRDAGCRNPRARVRRGHPQHLMPSLLSREGERQHRLHVAESRSRGEENPHQPIIARAPTGLTPIALRGSPGGWGSQSRPP